MDDQSSQFPSFSTQNSDYERVDQVSQTGTKRAPRGPGFSVEEDRLLVSAWLNTSLDPIQGNEQKLATFWGKIAEYYHQYKTFQSDRSHLMLSQRWGKIQKGVNKFSGCYAAITDRHESGKNEQDKIADAKNMYEAQERCRFNLDHAWILLRHQPKWLQLYQSLDNKKSKNKVKSGTNILSSSSVGGHIDIEEGDMNITSAIARPLGKKTEKRKLKETTDQLEKIQKLHLEKKERDEKKLELMKEKIKVDKEKLEVRKLEVEGRKIDTEMKIMAIDTSSMSYEEKEYYSKLKMKILQGEM